MNWSDPQYIAIAELLTAEFGVAFPPTRRAFAEAAMRRALGFAHERSLKTYFEHLQTDPGLLRKLIAEVTVGETYFFRDAGQFDVIRSVVLPDVTERSGNALPLRAWSAGCSTGEEAYSLAIVLDECELAQRAVIVATDVSSTSIETAQRGTYGQWSFRHDVEGWRERCFARAGKRWSVAPRYRHVRFAVHNLMQPMPAAAVAAGGFDLILCRNVMIYFDAQTVERAARLLADELAPGGWLLMSPTDPPLPAHLGLESVLTPAGIVYRRPAASAALVFAMPAALSRRAPVEAAPVAAVVLSDAPGVSLSLDSARDDREGVGGDTHDPGGAGDGDGDGDRDAMDALRYVERALRLLDDGKPHLATAQARRALFLDRSLAMGHLTLARALRLTGSRVAAQRTLRRGAALLEAQAPDDVVPGAGGVSAGTLSAVAAAEFDLLIGHPA